LCNTILTTMNTLHPDTRIAYTPKPLAAKI
jgi:hypothetical protein